MKLHKIVILAITFAATSVQAADYTFQGSGGDIATPANWGAATLEDSDVGTINSGGTYTLSKDLSLTQIKIGTTSECVFDFRDGGHTLNLSANLHQLDVFNLLSNGGYYVRLNGGTWDFGGKEFRGMKKNSQIYLQHGVVITNVTDFYSAYYAAPYSSLYVRGNPTYGASTIYCNSFCLAGKNTTNAKLTVETGGKILSSGSFYTDKNAEQNGLLANNSIVIKGAGSEISVSGAVFGYISSCNRMKIEDGGTWRTTGDRFLFGNGDKNSSSNSIMIADGTFVAARDFLIRNRSCDNVFAATNSTVTMGSFTNFGARTVVDIRNCTFTVREFYPFMRGGSRVRFSGADSVLTLADFVWKKGPFWTDVAGANPGSRLEIDDGATLTVGIGGNTQWMRESSNCTFVVSNGAKFITPSPGLSIGHDESLPYCHDNAVEVLSGGLLDIQGTGGNGFRTHGVNNTVLVSNGTIRASAVIIGYSREGPAASGCSLTLQGTTPRVESTVGSFWLHNDSVLRFELPASGYAEGHVPISSNSFNFNSAARVVVGYEDYLEAGGGDLTLMTFTTAPGDNGGVSFAQWISNQNTAMGLPKNCRLRYLPSDGVNPNRLVFHAHKPGGLILSFR